MAIAVDHGQLLRASVHAFVGVYPVTLPTVVNVTFRARAVQGHPAPNVLKFNCAIAAMKHSAIRAEMFCGTDQKAEKKLHIDLAEV
jgi:hypothetical protein